MHQTVSTSPKKESAILWYRAHTGEITELTTLAVDAITDLDSDDLYIYTLHAANNTITRFNSDTYEPINTVILPDGNWSSLKVFDGIYYITENLSQEKSEKPTADEILSAN